jgi:NAD(P)-dependent dehydrogenase (short-subunit alcohol dehydrogenase family)
MRILVVGASGVIGSAISDALNGRHEVVRASRSKSPIAVNVDDLASIRAMYDTVGRVDAVISAAGSAAFKPLEALTDADYAASLTSKLMGQVNLVRCGQPYLTDGGTFIVTSGTLSRRPMHGGAAISLANAAIEGWVRAAALELPRGIKVRCVSPGWVRETLVQMGRDGDAGVPAADVAQVYVRALTTGLNGAIIDV